MGEGSRKLPAHIEAMLSERDAQLNKLPVEELLERYWQNEVRVFVDRSLAIQAASSGVPTSSLTVLLSLLFPILLFSVPLAWYFFSWIYALAAIVVAVVVFRTSRALIVASVLDYSVSNPKLLDLLMSKGAIWFEQSSGRHQGGNKPTHEVSDQASDRHQESLSPAERMFSTASTTTSFFDLPSNHDGWHDVLDSVVAKLKAPVSDVFPHEAEGFVEAKCELLGYAAAYSAKLWSGTEVPQVNWNTLISSIENRIFERIKFRPDLSGYEEKADGSREFISYSSVYVTHMRDLERKVDRQYQTENYEHKELLNVFSPKEDLLTKAAAAEFDQVFERAVFLCSDELIPSLNEDF